MSNPHVSFLQDENNLLLYLQMVSSVHPTLREDYLVDVLWSALESNYQSVNKEVYEQGIDDIKKHPMTNIIYYEHSYGFDIKVELFFEESSSWLVLYDMEVNYEGEGFSFSCEKSLHIPPKYAHLVHGRQEFTNYNFNLRCFYENAEGFFNRTYKDSTKLTDCINRNLKEIAKYTFKMYDVWKTMND